MSIDLGTIVTYHEYDKGLACEDGVCIGHVTEIREYSEIPSIYVVRWWQSCNYHDYLPNRPYTYVLDGLWEIGQIPHTLLK